LIMVPFDMKRRYEPKHPEVLRINPKRQVPVVIDDAVEILAGSYSYADIAFYMAQLFGARMGAEITGETPGLLQWRERMTARPAVRAVVGPMADYIVSQQLTLPRFLSHLATDQRTGAANPAT